MQSSSPQLISIVLRNAEDAPRRIEKQQERGWLFAWADQINLQAPAIRLNFSTIEAFRPKGATLQ